MNDRHGLGALLSRFRRNFRSIGFLLESAQMDTRPRNLSLPKCVSSPNSLGVGTEGHPTSQCLCRPGGSCSESVHKDWRLFPKSDSPGFLRFLTQPKKKKIDYRHGRQISPAVSVFNFKKNPAVSVVNFKNIAGHVGVCGAVKCHFSAKTPEHWHAAHWGVKTREKKSSSPAYHLFSAEKVPANGGGQRCRIQPKKKIL